MTKNSDKIDTKRKTKKKSNGTVLWIFKILILTLFVSFTISLASEYIVSTSHIIIAYLLIAIILFISIFFDIIAVAATSCDEEPFHALSARKDKAGKVAVILAKNAARVSSICSDVVGDICGIVSGACCATIVARQFFSGNETSIFISVAFSSVLAALTIVGKSLSKNFAIKNANKVILSIAKLLSLFTRN